MEWIDELPDDIREFVLKLRDLPDFPRRLAEFASVLRRGQEERTSIYRKLALRARDLSPTDKRVRVLAGWATTATVPTWHFPMVHDTRRNAAYEQAIAEVVTPDSVVLDIGTGSGILGLMAARAGARHVYTCEREHLIAEVAREIIAHNGFADRVTVIGKDSTDLQIGADLPARADVLVSELIGGDLLSYGVLGATEDAMLRLLIPEPPIIPRRIALNGALVGRDAWTAPFRMGVVSGFDLSAFDRLAPYKVGTPAAGRSLDDALTDDFEIVHFDLTRPHQPEESKVIAVQTRRAGVAEAVLLWLRLELTPTVVLDSKPPGSSEWRLPLLCLFPNPITVREGETVKLYVEHNRSSMMIWPA